MKITVTRAAELKTSRWAGGTTTQLAIFPSDAEYQKFNFIWRISYATVEIPESTFTFMPGVTRHLMILDGELHIEHTGRYSRDLRPFDQDVFNGEWPTSAKGTVKDFNLMTRDGAEGRIDSLKLEQNEQRDLSPSDNTDVFSLYVESGELTVHVNESDYLLKRGDFMICEFEGSQKTNVRINCSVKSIVVSAGITLTGSN